MNRILKYSKLIMYHKQESIQVTMYRRLRFVTIEVQMLHVFIFLLCWFHALCLDVKQYESMIRIIMNEDVEEREKRSLETDTYSGDGNSVRKTLISSK